MRLLIQRVIKAQVIINQVVHSEIGEGLLVFLGVNANDEVRDIDLLIDKLIHLRIFSDVNGKINLSLVDLNLEVLLVSQYSLYAQYRKGRRPSFTQNANHVKAKELYDLFTQKLSKLVKVKTGVFQAEMEISLINNGPFTMMLDSEELK